jgi:hypothetical protein
MDFFWEKEKDDGAGLVALSGPPAFDLAAVYKVEWPSGRKSFVDGAYIARTWDWYSERAARVSGPDGTVFLDRGTVGA